MLLLQSRNFVQSTAKVHHAQLFSDAKIYSPFPISVATCHGSWSMIQILNMIVGHKSSP